MRKYKVLIILFGAVFFTLDANSQNEMLLYNMKTLPQRAWLNPAQLPDADYFLSIPGASAHVQFTNSSLSINALKETLENTGTDSVVLNLNKLANLLSEDNTITISNRTDFLLFGARFKRNYFTFNASLRNEFRFQYPEKLFDLLINGTGGSNLGQANVMNFGLEANNFMEYGVGLSHIISKKLVIGARAKYLVGLANISAADNSIYTYSDPNDYSLLLRPQIEAKVAYINPEVPKGKSEQDYYLENIGLNALNTGWAFDFGFKSNLNQRLSFSGGVRDLGSIFWVSNAFQAKSKNNAQIDFDGIDLTSIVDGSQSDDILTDLGDSLITVFELDTFSKEYRSVLRAKYFLGANFHLLKNHNVGILYVGEQFNSELLSNFSVSWNSKLTKILGLSGALNFRNGAVASLGLGMSFNLSFLQVFVVSDNIVSSLRVEDAKGVDLRFGLNLTFKRKSRLFNR